MIRSEEVIPAFLEACSGFESQWKEHVTYGESEPAGAFSEVASYMAHFDWLDLQQRLY